MRRAAVVVMGVSGSGKTTVAGALADALDVPVAEADSFHPPANIRKMSAGTPLTDEDRWPWLRSIADWIRANTEIAGADPGGCVVTCSALKRGYRDLLRSATGGTGDVWFLHLHGDRALLAARMGGRSGHFMPRELLDSQLADLEALHEDESGFTADITQPPERIVDTAISELRAWQRS